MIWFSGSLVLLAGFAAGMMATGALGLFFARGFLWNKRVWRVSAVDLALAAFLGTAAWVFLSASFSYLGITFNQMAPWAWLLLAVVVIGMLFLTATRRIRMPEKTMAVLAVGGAFLAGGVSLLPLALQNAFLMVGDPFTYVSIADFLQTHDFSTPIRAMSSFPAWAEAILYQESGLRMGTNFLLALGTAWLSPLRAVYVYPGILAWGVMLNGFGLFLWMRWGLKSSYSLSILGVFFVALTANPVQTSAAGGFFPQTFGTAFLLFSLAFLSKVLSRSDFSLPAAIGLGISWAAVVSMYSELFPVLGVVSLLTVLLHLRVAFQKKKIQVLIKSLLIAAVSALLCGNVEWLRMFRSLPRQMNAVVGWKIRLDFAAMWSEAVGAKPLNLAWNAGFVILTAALSLLILVGFMTLIKKRQVIPLVLACTWVVMAVFFWAGSAADPFKAAWSIHKITQWGFLSVLAVAFSALRSVRFASRKMVGVVVALTCIFGFIPLVSVLNFQGAATGLAAKSANPVEDFFQLARVVRAYKKNNVYQVSPAKPWPGKLSAYFLMDQPFIQGSWDGLPTSGAGQMAGFNNTESLYYCLDCPFPNPRNALLPANAVVIQQPVVADMSKEFKKPLQRKTFDVLDGETVCLTIFSIRTGLAALSVQTNSTQLKVFNDHGWLTQINSAETGRKPNIAFPLQRGYSQVCFQSSPAATVTLLDLVLSP